MLAALALIAFANAPTEPLDLLKEVRAHYRALSSFSMSIEHDGSSGLFPGRYSQSLIWRKGDRFKLLVTKKNPVETHNRAPDYYAEGGEVFSMRADGSHDRSSIKVDANTSPGWEVSGGLILGWLQDTPASRMMFNPPTGLEISWSYGDRKEWDKREATEIRMTVKGQDHVSTASLFVDPVKKEFLGFDYQAGKQKGNATYRNQKFNPPLPKDARASEPKKP